MPYYPETTVIQGLARIARERKLPPEAIPRPATQIIAGQPVEAMTVVLEGDILKDYHILDVAEYFKLRDPDQAAELIEVKEGNRVQFGQTLAIRGRGRRAKTLASPVNGQVIEVRNSRIVIQESAETQAIQARIPGEVEAADPHAVKIRGTGAVIQCVWGNGRFAYETYRFLPPEGFVALTKVDVRISEFRHVVIISPYPVNKGDLLVAQQQEAVGVVAPSMPANLREFAMGLKFPVMLTEGFGQRRPTELIYQLLQSNMGRQAAFNAVVPDRWAEDRPEIVIPLPSGGVVPTTPALDQALAVGAQVRITRAPWDGLVGEVVDLPAMPQVIDNGLRLPCAKVQISGGQTGLVPLANLELLGQSVTHSGTSTN